MNIFAVDYCPLIAATQLCDQHVNKMILESAQLLSTTVTHYGGEAPYKPTHRNHPCAVWLRESWSNVEWLVLHALGMAQEYTARFGKTHKSQAVVNLCADTLSGMRLPDVGLTSFALAMPDQFKVECPVESYRNFYRVDKIRFARWKRNKPDWLRI